MNASLDTFPNFKKSVRVDYDQLVALFYDTRDPVLSDKKVRNGLAYALPDTFKGGERVQHPYSPKSRYYNTDVAVRTQDFTHASLLIDSTLTTSSSSALQTLHIKTLSKYAATAKEVALAWEQVGVKTNIEEVEAVPDTFQIYLGDFNVPKDPDQYTLWHSGQRNNITKFRNLRIDKLLEDGRNTIDPEERQRIYFDFQKYLIDETPASFLYFPYEYEYVRR